VRTSKTSSIASLPIPFRRAIRHPSRILVSNWALRNASLPAVNNVETALLPARGLLVLNFGLKDHIPRSHPEDLGRPFNGGAPQVPGAGIAAKGRRHRAIFECSPRRVE
jgi:hypothetical protein